MIIPPAERTADVREYYFSTKNRQIAAMNADGRTERGKCLLRSICEEMGFDSLGFQTLDGMLDAIGIDRKLVCTYCWNGRE